MMGVNDRPRATTYSFRQREQLIRASAFRYTLSSKPQPNRGLPPNRPGERRGTNLDDKGPARNGQEAWVAERAEGAARRVRVAALLLITGLAAGPVGTHVYWLLGGTWGLHQSTSTGIRVVAAVVVVLLAAAVLVVLARVGFWQQPFVSDRVIRFFAWALAAAFLVESVAAFTWGRGDEWWLYGPVSLAIGLLALVVAGSSGAWPPRFNRPHRTLHTH
jgi:hypothetical protein